jgi:LysM repeat protein
MNYKFVVLVSLATAQTADPPAKPDGSCHVKILGNPAEGYDGYCYDLAKNSGIDLNKLNQYNNFNCASQGQRGQRLCVSNGKLPVVIEPVGKPDGTCSFKVLGNPAEGYDGYCYDLAAKAGIDIPTLNQYNNFDCASQGQPGQKLCVSKGKLPVVIEPVGKPDGTCYFKVLGNPADGYDGYCYDLAAKAGIDIPTLNQYNNFDCASQGQPGQKLCVSKGKLPVVIEPVGKPDGTCSFKVLGNPADGYDGYCYDLAAKAGIDIPTLNQYNNFDCASQGQPGQKLCVSKGKLPVVIEPVGKPDGTCSFKVLGNPADGYDGYCYDLAAKAGIDIPTLNQYNNFDCASQGQPGQKLCVSPGLLPQ